MLKTFLVLSSAIAVAAAIACTELLCQSILKDAEPLHCKGSTIFKGGFCGCTDACAKMEGEVCQAGPSRVRGNPPAGTCDTGLVCQADQFNILGHGHCVKSSQNAMLASKRSEMTLCQRRRIASMISQIYYKGQWFPKCDSKGRFLPEQCDNTGSCFCVNVASGVVMDGTKVLGSANCS